MKLKLLELIKCIYDDNTQFELFKVDNINRYELVVDIGCGTGRTTTSYLDKCSKLVGVDFSLASLKVFNNKLKKYNNNNVYLIQGDATNLPLKNNIFNKALSIGVFSHIPTDNYGNNRNK